MSKMRKSIVNLIGHTQTLTPRLLILAYGYGSLYKTGVFFVPCMFKKVKF